jgi:hypothetical protein
VLVNQAPKGSRPPKGSFVLQFASQSGQVQPLLSFLGMARPFQPLRDADLDALVPQMYRDAAQPVRAPSE